MDGKTGNERISLLTQSNANHQHTRVQDAHVSNFIVDRIRLRDCGKRNGYNSEHYTIKLMHIIIVISIDHHQTIKLSKPVQIPRQKESQKKIKPNLNLRNWPSYVMTNLGDFVESQN
jgi:hypothetical protein